MTPSQLIHLARDLKDRPKCTYFGCAKTATVAIPRVRGFNCTEHWSVNLLRFGCPDMFEELPKKWRTK